MTGIEFLDTAKIKTCQILKKDHQIDTIVEDLYLEKFTDKPDYKCCIFRHKVFDSWFVTVSYNEITEEMCVCCYCEKSRTVFTDVQMARNRVHF